MPWRGAGVSVPVFSIRSEADLGVGEFLDLKLLVDWSVASGFHLVQLLPINDTSVHKMWWDSYPYRYNKNFDLKLHISNMSFSIHYITGMFTTHLTSSNASFGWHISAFPSIASNI